MTRLNHRVLVIFLGGLVAVVLAYSAWDVTLYLHGGSADTISWAMAQWGYGHPFGVFVLGFLCCAATGGLAVHFWAGMPDPRTVQRLKNMAAENARLRRRLRESEGRS